MKDTSRGNDHDRAHAAPHTSAILQTMAEAKTKPTPKSVENFLNKISDEGTRRDCFELVALMKKITKADPVMWGTSIVGFGSYHYKYPSGREGDSGLTGFSPRKQNLAIYVVAGFEARQDLMSKLGKYKTGVVCLYVKRLADIDKQVLTELIEDSIEQIKKREGEGVLVAAKKRGRLDKAKKVWEKAT